MDILIDIDTDSELKSYEAVSLGFVLASFDHHVQFCVCKNTLPILTDPTSRLYGMIQSLHLYDLPKAWTDIDQDDLPDVLKAHFGAMTDKTFNHRLRF